MEGTSEEWRNRGNEDFIKAKEALRHKPDSYQGAMHCYRRAMDLAKTDREYSSAAKNYATTCTEVYKYYETKNDKEKKVEYMSGSLAYLSKAISRGASCQWAEWLARLSKVYESYLQKASELAKEFQPQERADVLQTLMKDVSDDEVKPEWMLKAVKLLHDQALELIENNDLVLAASLLTDATKPLERAKSFGIFVTEWEDTIDFCQTLVQAKREFAKAETVLKEATDRSTTSNFHLDLLLTAIDKFTNCIEVAEESHQLELEAEAYGRLGHIYESILHNSERAKGYYHKCIYVADTVVPKDFLSKDWYTECVEALKKYQKQAVDEDEDVEFNRKRKHLEELKDDLSKLRKVAEAGCTASLLVFIAEEFPPKSGTLSPLVKKDLLQLEKTQLRREALKLVMRYHPDRQRGTDEKWKVFCEEVTKEINKVLERLC